jgi:hypothetical protein
MGFLATLRAPVDFEGAAIDADRGAEVAQEEGEHMLTTNSILPYVLSRPLRTRAQVDFHRIGVDMPPLWTPVGP